MAHSELIRNPALVAELQAAIQRRRYDGLFALLRRLSGLPGPRANDALAWIVGEEVARAGGAGDALIGELCAMSPMRAPAGSDSEFLPMVGAACLGARLAMAGGEEALPKVDTPILNQLRLLAEDPRHRVRDGVCRALAEASRTRGTAMAELLASWTDGYLSAAVALDVLTARTWLDRARSADAVLERLEEAFVLAESASRSDQRSQGYRLLIKGIGEVPVKLLDRFLQPTLTWLESKASTPDVALREALAELLAKARARGHGVGALEKVHQALDESAPPRRDPKTYVGPTRKRGGRRR